MLMVGGEVAIHEGGVLYDVHGEGIVNTERAEAIAERLSPGEL
jgi:hypothetical protein